MSQCTDCPGGTPSSAWKRCMGCSMLRLRHIMSGGQVPLVTNRFGGFARGTRVTVDGLPGTVLRLRQSEYIVKMDDGTRVRTHVSKLQKMVESKDEDS